MAVERLRAAVERGERICVHGDYDVDGICSTALAVLTLREIGADVGWHLPSRFEEGYGVSAATIARLAEEGVKLILTVDCGITAVAEVEEARRLGVDMIVTDHHRPGDTLPDCPIVATRPSDYPFPDLCGTGVVVKLAQALLGADHPAIARHQDLVALATIADVVPLVDENRALASTGLRALSRTQKPGLRALMRVAGVDPATVDATAVGFRLAPRLNAAGRLGRPDVGLHLVLTQDDREADLLANELETLNRDRQAVEERILREAVAVVNEWPAEKRSRRAYVVWGEGWHEGVIGIVASRLVERFGRPVVLIAGEGDSWKGSGRSVPSFDLHAGLAACSDHLERFGGHRAAAGLTIRGDELEPFAAAFAAYADGELLDEDLAPVTRIDAIVPASALTLELARELEQLSPFGLGNPDVTLLVAGLRGGRRFDGRGRQAPALPRTPARARCGQRDRIRARRPAGAAPGRLALRRGVQAQAEPLERHRVAAARRAAGVRHRGGLRRIAALARGAVAGGRDRVDTRGAARLRRARDRGCGRQAAAARVADLPGPARARRADHAAAGGVEAGARTSAAAASADAQARSRGGRSALAWARLRALQSDSRAPQGAAARDDARDIGEKHP